ncbi:aldo/keto reductase [Paratractidigestivibacter sp.]|uniref:aldo/keto reductase n=1 Tax=Paratractidigestivibacter sp. TaxID=2847316 RepID=UPI002ABDA048|nr:aldo/keto reductase [Paratractidigestivibacter sp.]
MSVLNENYTLADGTLIPRLGLGTWLMDDATATAAVKSAVACGYRMIDTAQAYGNEAGVGEGIRTCGVARDQLFVATKVAGELKDYQSVAASIDESLSKLGLDYVDQMILHSPQPWVEVNQSDDRHEEGNLAAWRALEDAQAAGKVRVIGVSNFLAGDIDNILAGGTVKPQVNQVLTHISNTPFELLDYCAEKGILVEAYSPIAHGEVLGNPLIAEVAGRYGVTPAQLCIRYCLELGMLPLPKATSAEHIADDARVDFQISTEDMQTLRGAERIKDYGESSFWPVFGGKL